jgi:hypothetical protein
MNNGDKLISNAVHDNCLKDVLNLLVGLTPRITRMILLVTDTVTTGLLETKCKGNKCKRIVVFKLSPCCRYGIFYFWVFPRGLNIKSQRFGTLCRFHLHRWVWWNRQSVPKCRLLISRRKYTKCKHKFCHIKINLSFLRICPSWIQICYQNFTIAHGFCVTEFFQCNFKELIFFVTLPTCFKYGWGISCSWVRASWIDVNNCPTRCNLIQFSFPSNCSTCFGWYVHPSSGVRVNCNYSIWNRSNRMLPSAVVKESGLQCFGWYLHPSSGVRVNCNYSIWHWSNRMLPSAVVEDSEQFWLLHDSRRWHTVRSVPDAVITVY